MLSTTNCVSALSAVVPAFAQHLHQAEALIAQGVRREEWAFECEMETEKSEWIVITKPLAYRPHRSNFKPFPDLFSVGGGGVLSTKPAGEPLVIRPKTLRFKPPPESCPNIDCDLSVDDFDSEIHYSPTKIKGQNAKIYKPVAKFISRGIFPLIESIGDHAEDSAQVQRETQTTAQTASQLESLVLGNHDSHPSCLEAKPAPSSLKPESFNPDRKMKRLVSSGDRISFDGYNWRKYGQKQVKGSEYPRSYYKCTHPNCPVKKKVERSLDGKIAEIVYNGEHSHPRPQQSKRPPGKNLVVDGGKPNCDLSTSLPVEKNDEWEDRSENNNEMGLQITSAYSGNVLFPYDCGIGAPDTPFGVPCGYSDKRKPCGDDCNSSFKKRRNDDKEAGASTATRNVGEPNFRMQTSTDSDVLNDGFRWRKYGQKVVKGNLYPRSYYRCADHNCNVRKHVERSADDPRAVITTYEGKHNHEMPLQIPTEDAHIPAFDESNFHQLNAADPNSTR